MYIYIYIYTVYIQINIYIYIYTHTVHTYIHQTPTASWCAALQCGWYLRRSPGHVSLVPDPLTTFPRWESQAQTVVEAHDEGCQDECIYTIYLIYTYTSLKNVYI